MELTNRFCGIWKLANLLQDCCSLRNADALVEDVEVDEDGPINGSLH